MVLNVFTCCTEIGSYWAHGSSAGTMASPLSSSRTLPPPPPTPPARTLESLSLTPPTRPKPLSSYSVANLRLILEAFMSTITSIPYTHPKNSIQLTDLSRLAFQKTSPSPNRFQQLLNHPISPLPYVYLARIINIHYDSNADAPIPLSNAWFDVSMAGFNTDVDGLLVRANELVSASVLLRHFYSRNITI